MFEKELKSWRGWDGDRIVVEALEDLLKRRRRRGVFLRPCSRHTASSNPMPFPSPSPGWMRWGYWGQRRARRPLGA